ncbi:GNAT family N-acetyltransferase [Roseateles asaccharophilus]|uniref:GNAT superfamily N-acetyltransferase n=1 Tax=Roseateles asaccharophilus TaxID=582607 RepID=A0ABU2A8A6_9BURK|nr:GNAT family N-acetyltransferase [Roseateles asaccharophilus]MDR7332268.1 GNAT superfamily N-acetyltransferase [Roseateles asaccharophilus]
MPTADDELAGLVLAWLHGWSISRQVPAPIAHADGYRVEVQQPRHARRYVFDGPSPTLAQLGRSITEPWVFLKACATADALRALLPAHWQMEADGFLMSCGDQPLPTSRPLPPGYVLALTGEGDLVSAQVLAPDGASASAGHVALGERWATYDRIITEPAHQRLGLGRAVMAALQARAHARGRHAGVLVATPEGRRLYESLGWQLRAPWATAVIAGQDDAVTQSPPTK